MKLLLAAMAILTVMAAIGCGAAKEEEPMPSGNTSTQFEGQEVGADNGNNTPKAPDKAAQDE